MYSPLLPRTSHHPEPLYLEQPHEGVAFTSLTLVARWQLLAYRRFPHSRAELPGQLSELGMTDLASGLDATIGGYPRLERLAEFLDVAQRLVEQTAPTRELRRTRQLLGAQARL
jgi:hypothetical protein